jgi:hypothetical protein
VSNNTKIEKLVEPSRVKKKERLADCKERLAAQILS